MRLRLASLAQGEWGSLACVVQSLLEVRVPVVTGDYSSEVLVLLQECGHAGLLVEGAESALAAIGGVLAPLVVVTNHATDRTALIRDLRNAGAWIIGAAAGPDVERLAGADDWLPLPASADALRARLHVAKNGPGLHAERSRTLAQLMVADRLLSLGTLASGVAHEINNPLAITMANLEFALDELGPESAKPNIPETLQALREALEGARRVGGIVRELHTFARIDGAQRIPLSVPQTVERALTLASSELRHRARVVLDLAEVPRVDANEQQLGQVVLNLLTNAAQSIPEGSVADNEIRVRTALEAGRVVIEVSDTGVGIPAENLKRIFDPFFTTKPPGQGTGLGLAMCHSLVGSFGGEIVVESRPTGGTTFRVLLPPVAEQAVATPIAEAPKATAVRRGRILVVDDEPLLGRTVERTLGTFHEVVFEVDARAALERIVAGETFDVILCDLMMPEMSGMELHARLGQVAPEQQSRMYFMTGGAFTPAAQAFLESLKQPWLAKPFEAAQLKDAIASRLS